ncbi:MAG: serine/threonine protein kinase [Ardenticatenaceae bacterium]|nr:serine/threonine protein kinase [Ardenticatenaceae bacterium]MCB8991122.1 serine/threonine protein kinase [Ardenticatenaceae bacterium]MCB9005278.1 serine/threonine protein kinase [Ardenticatenaceae bacterium]
MAIDFNGQTIGQYRVQELVKERLNSSLYVADDSKSHKPVFLEILHTTAEENADLAGQFQRRMTTISQLQHPHIAPVLHTSQTDEKRPYAIIKHAPGSFLDTQFAEWHANNSWPDPTAALQFIRHIADALTVAHPAGIIHHDLRPANILLQPDGTPLLIDLGIPIRNIPTELHIKPGQVHHLDYASPEQQSGQPLSGPSNIYSLGIMLYEMLAGAKPAIPISQWSIFEQHLLPQETPLQEVRGDLTPKTYKLVKNCLWRQEWNRYETVQQMLTALDTAVSAEQNPRPLKKTKPTSKPRPWLLYGGIVIALLIVAAIVFLLIR